MKFVSFQLTMPVNAAWDRKWTGDTKKYYVIKKYSDKVANSLIHLQKVFDTGSDGWSYSFGDGWVALIRAEVINAPEAKKRRLISQGFWGYQWMIESILKHGKIIS